MVTVTLWPLSRWREALPALRAIRPGAIMLHSDPATLETRAPGIVNGLRTELGSAMPREVWLGVAFDVGARGNLSPAALERERFRAANAANAIGAAEVMLNAEAAWKRGAPGFDRDAAERAVAGFRDRCPGRRITVTSFDCPGYHSAFPWSGFDGCDRWAPQVYAAPAQGADPPRAGRNGRSRLALHQREWAKATARGWLKPRPVTAYVQSHHVVDRETCAIANAFSDVAFWAFPSRADDGGRRAAQALAEIERRGFAGAGRVEAFQRATGLSPDGLVGRETMRALGVS